MQDFYAQLSDATGLSRIEVKDRLFPFVYGYPAEPLTFDRALTLLGYELRVKGGAS